MAWCNRTTIAALSALLLWGASSNLNAQQTPSQPLPEVDQQLLNGKMLLAKEFPDVIKHMARNDGFGGSSSRLIANAMLSRDPALVAEARAKMQVEPIAKGLWLIHFPYVNVVLIETRDRLVLFDTGYAAIGPVLRDVIPTLSSKPLRTIIISHTHVDHMGGAFALVRGPIKPDVITSDLLPKMYDVDIRLGRSIGRYNNQNLAYQPKSRADVVWPTITFHDKLERMIGGEKFVFFHAEGETQDQIYAWLPQRNVVISADYYQGFLPNAGNGKRLERHVDEWAAALRHMVSLKPDILLPTHGAAIRGRDKIAAALTLHADAMEFISKQVFDKLNQGVPKDEIFAHVEWPERFAHEPALAQSYNRPEDIAKMVAHRWTGWWDDIPSHFAAVPFSDEAKEVVSLAGGIDVIDQRARALLPSDPRLAARLADWAERGAPDNPKALKLAVDIYMARIAADDTPLQESIIYFETAARARAKLAALAKKG